MEAAFVNGTTNASKGSNASLSSGASIRFGAVTKRFGPVAALEEFSLAIEPGQFMTLLGPSGSGKTTALNILAGFDDPTSGDIWVDDRSMRAVPPERRDVGMVFQNFALFPHRSVEDNVAFPLRMRGVGKGEARRRANQTLEMVRLGGLGGRRPSELSGGQKQRVALARALVYQPRVLLMDECLSALDLKLREQMQIEIKRLHEALRCTILFVTHDQGEALTLSDRIAVMRDGRIEQEGDPATIYDRPATRFVAEFIGKTNTLALERDPDGKARLPALEMAFDWPVHWQDGLAMVSVRPEAFLRAPDANPAFDARIESTLFLGETAQYIAIAPDGTDLLLRERRHSGSAILKRGDQVRLTLDPATLVPLADDNTQGRPQE